MWKTINRIEFNEGVFLQCLGTGKVKGSASAQKEERLGTEKVKGNPSAQKEKRLGIEEENKMF